MDLNTQKWQTRAIYPFASKFSVAATLNHEFTFLVFGGYSAGESHPSAIARYTPSTDKWEKLGDLHSARTMSAVVLIFDSFLVIGGNHADGYKTERCTLVENAMSCVYQAPDFGIYSYPQALRFNRADCGI